MASEQRRRANGGGMKPMKFPFTDAGNARSAVSSAVRAAVTPIGAVLVETRRDTVPPVTEEDPEDLLMQEAPKLPSLPPGAIGTILIESGRLATEAAERVFRHHQERGVPFGQAAVELGLLEVADVQFALARQFAFPLVPRNDTSIAPEVVAAFNPAHQTVEQLHHLREQLMLSGFGSSPERKAVAITSAERNAGRSFVAANLAVVFAQLGQRTLLLDAHLQRPRQHQLFRSENRVGLSTVLAERATNEAILRHPSLPALSLLPAGPSAPNPQDLLARPSFAALLQSLGDRFDVLILDGPPWLEGLGARMVAAAAASSLIIARTRCTPADGAARVARELSDARITTYGVVLNRH